jgi:hypothetical protein
MYLYKMSQALQDLFAIRVLKNKTNGTFVEIGSNHPIAGNNTYLMESKFNWKGLMIEYDRSFEQLYKDLRPNSIYRIGDARLVDYRGILDKNQFPSNIDYLQIDLDVNNKSTLDTLVLLDNTCFDKYKFATITFEHDIYRGNFFNTREISRKIFKKRGYELVFPDVAVFFEGRHCPFEDWYVHPDLVDMDYVNGIRSSVGLKVEEIQDKLREPTDFA